MNSGLAGLAGAVLALFIMLAGFGILVRHSPHGAAWILRPLWRAGAGTVRAAGPTVLRGLGWLLGSIFELVGCLIAGVVRGIASAVGAMHARLVARWPRGTHVVYGAAVAILAAAEIIRRFGLP